MTTPTSSGYYGATPGDFAVDPNGQACYRIGLSLPPGAGGWRPELALQYGSADAQGQLGLGWSLNGLSTISRCGATQAQDGFWSAVDYGTTDRLRLDAQRLVPFGGGAYWDAGTIYRTEVESWSQVVPVGTPDGGGAPSSFTVYDSDGSVRQYGEAVAACGGSTDIRLWALTQHTDRNGNDYTVSYAQQDGDAGNDYWPTAIVYTGNAAAAALPQCQVLFDYASYSAAADQVPIYLAGYGVQPVMQLQGITIQVLVAGAWTTVKQYTLAYSAGTASGRSRLASVTEADGEGRALPATTFVYQDWTSATAGLPQTSGAATAATLPAAGAPLPIDLDGDGITELVWASPSQADLPALVLTVCTPAADGGFTAAATVDTELSWPGVLLPMDVDGDGAVELVYVTVTGTGGSTSFAASLLWWNAATSTFDSSALALPSLATGGSFVAVDLDGDGGSDLAYLAGYASGEQTLLQVTPLVYGDGEGGPAFTVASGGTLQTNLSWIANPSVCALDFDGDQLGDLVWAFADGQGNLQCALMTSTGAGFASPQLLFADSSGFPFVDGALVAADVNGDGLDDLVFAYPSASDASATLSVAVLLSTGSAPNVVPIAATTSLAYQGNLLPVTCYGNGLTDLCVVSAGNLGVSILPATQLLQGGALAPVALSLTAPAGALPMPMDLAGLGRSDLVWTNSGAQSTSLSSWTVGSTPYPDLLSVVTNGLGGSWTVTYATLTDTDVYSPSAAPAAGTVDIAALVKSVSGGQSGFSVPALGTAPSSVQGSSFAVVPFVTAKYVVSAYTASNGRGDAFAAAYDYQFGYSGALVDLLGRGWLGFAATLAGDVASQNVTVHSYHQVFPLTGQATSTLVDAWTPSSGPIVPGATLTSQVSTYLAQNLGPASGPPYGPYLVRAATTTSSTYTDGVADTVLETTYTHDAWGNPTRVMDWNAALPEMGVLTLRTYWTPAADWTAGDPWALGVVLSQTAMAAGGPTQVFAARRVELDDISPPTWNVTRASFYTSGALDDIRSWDQFQYQYDAWGNTIERTDPNGAVTRFDFDSTGSYAQRVVLPATAAGTEMTYHYDWAPSFCAPRKLDWTDPNGQTFTRTFDGLFRLSSTSAPGPTGQALVATYAWSADAIGVYVDTRSAVDWPGSVWKWTKAYMDGLGRTFRVATPAADGTRSVFVDTLFDNRGHVIQRSLPYYVGDDVPATIYSIERAYDAWGRLVSESVPAWVDDAMTSALTSWSYVTSNEIVRTDPLGYVTTFLYQYFRGQRLLTRRTDHQQNVTTLDYDAFGRLLATVDPLGVTTASTYDGLGRVLSDRQFAGSSRFWAYDYAYDDAAGTARRSDAAGNACLEVYDALYRRTSKTILVGAAEQSVARYFYDVRAVNGLTRLCGVEKSYSSGIGGSSYTFAYDPCGNVSEAISTVDGAPAELRFARTWSPLRELDSATFPNGWSVNRSYNVAGWLASIAGADDSGSSLSAAFADYTPGGCAQAVRLGNGSRQSYQCDPSGTVLVTFAVGDGANTLVDRSFSRDLLGRVVAIADEAVPANGEAYTYDFAGRLLSANGPYGSQTYAYDADGNLLARGASTFSYDGQQLVTGTVGGAGTAYAYDANGNLVSVSAAAATTTYDFDGENQLATARGADLDGGYAYDHEGRRVYRTVGGGAAAGGVTSAVPDRDYEVLRWSNGSSPASLQVMYVRGPRGVLAAVGSGAAGAPPGLGGPGVSYLSPDHRRSVVLVQDGATTSVAYDPFGSVDGLDGADDFPHKFAGHRLDEDSGLYYCQARYYDPVTARMISADSQVSALTSRHMDGLHRYAYCLNDPVNRTDLTGRASGDEIAQFVIDAAEIVAGVAVIVGCALSGAGAGVGATFGRALLGAGISGMIYDATQAIRGRQVEWGAWTGSELMGAFSAVFITVGAGIAEEAAIGYDLSDFAVGAAKVAGGIGAGALETSIKSSVWEPAEWMAFERQTPYHNAWVNVGTQTAGGALNGGVQAAFMDPTEVMQGWDNLGYAVAARYRAFAGRNAVGPAEETEEAPGATAEADAGSDAATGGGSDAGSVAGSDAEAAGADLVEGL